MDEALWLPTEKAVTLALRTQQIIAHESGVANSVDPLGGSYLIEYLTDEIEQHALAYIEKIDQMGGALAAIEQGFVQGEIQEAAYTYQKEIESNDQVVVGVNQFIIDEKIELDRLQVDPSIETEQRDRLVDLRKNRDQTRVVELLNKLEAAARGSENLMPLLIVCVENQITLGEMCNTLRGVWGEYQPPAWI
jgi:methylmalonyl-CoA mutase N-terminal domain/subunit